MLNACLNEIRKVINFSGKATRYKAAIGSNSKQQRVACRAEGSLWSCFGDEAMIAGRRRLAFGKAVNLVIVHQVGNIDVAAHGVQEMVTPFAIPVAVTALSYYR